MRLAALAFVVSLLAACAGAAQSAGSSPYHGPSEADLSHIGGGGGGAGGGGGSGGM